MPLLAAGSVNVSPSAVPRHRSWPRRHRRSLVLAGMLLILVLPAGGAAASWYFSSKVVVPERPPWPTNATVKALFPGKVVLSRSKDTLRPGVYGLEWPSGHAIVAGVLSSDADTVTRKLTTLQGHLGPGTKVSLSNNAYKGDPEQALGLPFANVKIPDELGPMPAWLIPGRSRTWAIFVHGINANREDGLRIVPTLHAEVCPAC